MKINLRRFSVEISIFFALLFTGAAFHHPVEYDNTLSRFFLVHSIVDRGLLNIDDNEKITIDDSFSDGHYYSNKAIGAPLIAVPFYWIITKLPFKKTPYADLNVNIEELYLVRVLTTTVPFAILGVILYSFSGILGRGGRGGVWMVLCYSFGTIALVHSMLFSGHQIAGSFSFFSFFLLYRLESRRDSASLAAPFKAFLAGLLAGLAALSDYTAMYIALSLTLYLFFLRIPVRERFLFLVGGTTCIATLGWYNYLCFGNPLSLSYGHLVEKGFREGSQSGFMGVSWPDPQVLFKLLLSPSRGLLFISPVLLFSLYGLYEMRRDYLREMVLIIMLSAGYLFINAGFYGWHGGWSYGPRYLVPVLPFLALPAAFSIRRGSKLLLLLLGLSSFQVSLAAFGVPHTPDLFKNPVGEFIFPLLGYGYVARSAGNLIGLKWIYGAIPVIIVTVSLIFYAFLRLPPAVGPLKSPGKGFLVLSGTLFIYIVSMLLFFRSPTPLDQEHVYKSNMLYMYSKATDSEEVYMGGLQEELKAREQSR